MRPATHDFDVVTDAPRGAQAPRRRLPDPAEQPPPLSPPQERAVPLPRQETERVRAAE